MSQGRKSPNQDTTATSGDLSSSTTQTRRVVATTVVPRSSPTSKGQELINRIETYLSSRLHGPWDKIMNDTAQAMLEELRSHVV